MTHKTTDLVILNAMAFTAPLVVTIGLPHLVPVGCHGNWIGRGHVARG